MNVLKTRVVVPVRRQMALPLIISSVLAMSGCAGTLTWSPELEEAEQLFERISSDPSIAAQAPEEYARAQEQLVKAQNASDFFKGKKTIAHEANLAKTRILIAQQRVRAVRSQQNLQVAIATQKQTTDMLVAAVEQSVREPVVAAALPVTPSAPAPNERIAELQQRIAELEKAVIEQPAAATEPANQLSDYRPARPAIVTMTEQVIEPDRQLQQALHAMNAHPGPNGMTLVLSDRYFDGNTARLWNQRAARHLDSVAEIMKGNSSLKVSVEGYTDDINTTDLNQMLSKERAIAVKTALIQRGIEAARITADGFGEARPIASNETPQGRQKNRRVEIIFPQTTLANR
jgi:outer membrane protein OmpA-like peptidoglycan-associated protein